MGVYIFALPEATQDLLLPVFTIINPYKTGAWIMGIGFLVTCLWGKGKAGLVLGVVLLVCYLITAFVSLVGLMVVTTGFDLLWYLHPIPVVIGCIDEVSDIQIQHIEIILPEYSFYEGVYYRIRLSWQRKNRYSQP